VAAWAANFIFRELLMRRLFLGLIPIVGVAVACSDSRSPSSPSPTPGSALITGVVSGSSSPSGDASGAGFKVSVAGTNLEAIADGAGRFTLQNVPPGDVRLQFASPSATASVDVPNVRQSEAIALSVVVTPEAAVVESQQRSLGNDTELEGRVEKLPPESPANTLVVAGVTVLTNASTQFFLNGSAASFGDLQIGYRVHVKGNTNPAGILALLIEIQNTNPDIPVNLNGIVDDFVGGAHAFEFMIDGRLVKGNDETEFFGGSDFADLDDGVRAEVKGVQRNGFVLAVRIHVNVDEGGGGNNQSASIEGLLTSIVGNPPVLIVDGVTVRTSLETVVRRGGDTQPLSVLDLQMTVHVVGDRQGDGSIDARMVQIKGDAPGGKFQISGAAGGVKGTCPALTFGVNGYDIVTDGATAFSPPPGCSALKSGTQVTVNGIVQANGSVKATSVVRQ
jgi:hypothetical protein